MKTVRDLTSTERIELVRAYKNDPRHHFRVRCKGILLSDEKLSVKEIANRLEKKKDTIYNWINQFDKSGILGLENRPGQGNFSVFKKMTSDQIDYVDKAVQNEPQNLDKVSGELSKHFDLSISKTMLISFLKKT